MVAVKRRAARRRWPVPSRRCYDGLSDVIASGQADGSIREDVEPGTAAVLVLGMMRGIAALLLTDAGITDMTSVRKTCDEWIDSSLGRPED